MLADHVVWGCVHKMHVHDLNGEVRESSGTFACHKLRSVLMSECNNHQRWLQSLCAKMLHLQLGAAQQWQNGRRYSCRRVITRLQ